MPFDLTLLVAMCACTIAFTYRRIKLWPWKVLIFIATWIVGIILAFTIGWFVGQHQGDKNIALRYITQGFWLTLFGCIIGAILSKKIKYSNVPCHSLEHNKRSDYQKDNQDKLNDAFQHPKKVIIIFGTDTLLKRCGLTLIGASLLFYISLCLYWNFACMSFFHGDYLMAESGSDFPIRTNSIEQFNKFMSSNSFYTAIMIGIFFGFVLFSGFANTLAAWLKTGSWPKKVVKKNKP